jgi:hypothetical protein
MSSKTPHSNPSLQGVLRRYAAMQSKILASLIASHPGAPPLTAIGGLARLRQVTRLAQRLGKTEAEQIADFELLVEAARYRQTMVTTTRTRRLVATWLRLLREIAAKNHPVAGVMARLQLAKYRPGPIQAATANCRRRANMARRGLKRLQRERPELIA